MAIVLSSVTGWPLEQEPAMLLYLAAMPLTLLAIGAITGCAAAVVLPRPRDASRHTPRDP
jgi:hypothetical protein